MTIQRYSVDYYEPNDPVERIEDDDGRYVLFDDHAAEVERFRETIRNREQAELTALAELDEARAEVATAVAREREEMLRIVWNYLARKRANQPLFESIKRDIESRPTPGAAKEEPTQ